MSYLMDWACYKQPKLGDFKGQLETLITEEKELFTGESYKVSSLTTTEKRFEKRKKKIRKKNRKRYYERKKRGR